MKIIALLLLFLLCILSCTADKYNTKIEVHVNGLKKGTIYLEKLNDSTLTVIDSVKIDGHSNGIFSLNIESPEVFFIYLRKGEGAEIKDGIDLFVEPGWLTLKTNLDAFESDAIVTGSANHDKYIEYKKIMQRFSDRELDLLNDTFLAQKNNDTEQLYRLEQHYQLLIRNKYLTGVNFALNHAHMEIAPYITISEIFNANIKYLDTIYTTLTPEIKNSKYGLQLEKYIVDRKKL